MTIWYHTYKQMHTTLTKTNRLTHKYILATPITYSQQLSVLHWINHSLTLKINFMKVNNILIFQKSLIEEAAYLLIRFNKTKSFLWNTRNTNRNCVNEQKKHTPHTKREITLERVSMRISDTPFFANNSPILPSFYFIRERSEPLFLGKFWKLKSPLPRYLL